MIRTLKNKFVRLRFAFFMLLIATIVLSYFLIDAQMKLHEASVQFPLLVWDIKRSEYIDSLHNEIIALEIDIFELRGVNMQYRLSFENMKEQNDDCANLVESLFKNY
jgi:hypothetical protein